MDMSWLTVGIGILVALIWTASMIVELVSSQTYKTPLEVHGLMGTIVGALYTHERIRRSRR